MGKRGEMVAKKTDKETCSMVLVQRNWGHIELHVSSFDWVMGDLRQSC